MSSITIQQIAYGGWTNCYRLTNGDVELIATSDIGPRVMRYGFTGGQNLFYECRDQLGGSREPWWMIRGGHRLWIAPETVPETYALDNAPVEAAVTSDNTLVLTQPVEPETKLQKEMSIVLQSDGSARLDHRIQNCGPKPCTFAPWPATLLAPGGIAFAAFPSRATHEQNLLPTNPLVMWAYTDFSDPRWQFTKKYVTLRQDTSVPGSQKTGLFNERTFAAYLLNSELFTKQCTADSRAAYADYHSSFEIFTNPDFMELETLGPLTQLNPGDSISHTEHWSLHRSVQTPAITDEALDRLFLPLMR